MTDNELFLLILMLVMGLPWLIWRLLGDADQAPLVVVQIFVGVLLGPGVLGAAAPDHHVEWHRVMGRDAVRMAGRDRT